MSRNKNKPSLKTFFIKLFAITLALIIVINMSFNLIVGERLEKIDKIISLNDKEERDQFKNKIRSEITKGLEKDRLLDQKDAELLYKFFIKVKNEILQAKPN